MMLHEQDIQNDNDGAGRRAANNDIEIVIVNGKRGIGIVKRGWSFDVITSTGSDGTDGAGVIVNTTGHSRGGADGAGIENHEVCNAKCDRGIDLERSGFTDGGSYNTNADFAVRVEYGRTGTFGMGHDSGKNYPGGIIVKIFPGTIT